MNEKKRKLIIKNKLKNNQQKIKKIEKFCNFVFINLIFEIKININKNKKIINYNQ